ncbi:type IV pilus secretin PilQ [Trinickia fusca]|uniref:Type IV pilus secretin PilQ n=1 Tax=Trinickia fusca TaxID=2419777 RepID=A0A494X151_9BURK|nr:type IV pilus secretin PilQ [Trinickia fusca]RKP44040.1 type IV pilus secretin PilQ [Trinickia fusca]
MTRAHVLCSWLAAGALSASTSWASVPLLPPLPLEASSGEENGQAWPREGTEPLPNPFVGGPLVQEQEDGPAARETSGDHSESGLRSDEPAQSAGSAGAASHEPPVESAARSPALEGPPIPLAPPLRMSSENQNDGGANDDKPVTMHFQNAQLSDVLDAFARFTGLNIVASERVRGAVSVHLTNVPWRTAFDTLLDVHGLAMSRRDNVIWVAPLADLAARERQRFEAHARSAELEPLASRAFALRYPRAEDVQRLLTASGAQRILSKRGAAVADARTNLLFVTDLEARLAQVAELIATIDKPSRQVLIEARIVEGARGFSQNLGARLSIRAGSLDAKTAIDGQNGIGHDLSAGALSGFGAATAGFTLFAAQATRLVTTELSALEAEGRGHIVSSPRVVTADRTKAVVEQGTELPYQAKVRSGVSGVQFRRASLKLEVEPQITPHGRIVLDLEIAKDSVGEPTAAGPAIDTKHVRTRVEVEDGGTVSIGGIYERQDRNDVTRVPLLGKIPLIGALFRHRAQREQSSELAVFITPRIIGVD